MAERPTASPSGRRQPARAAQPSIEQNTDTARINLHGGRGAVPGWFWALLGCLSVLGVGLAGLFVVVKLLPAHGAGIAAEASAGGPGGAMPGKGGGIQVEQLASPPSPALAPLPPARPRLPPHALKVARSPSGARRGPDTAGSPASAAGEPEEAAAPAAEPAADNDSEPPAEKAAADSDEAPRSRKATTAAARERRPREKPPADDSDDNDSSDNSN